jgi:hypothetical protein
VSQKNKHAEQKEAASENKKRMVNDAAHFCLSILKRTESAIHACQTAHSAVGGFIMDRKLADALVVMAVVLIGVPFVAPFLQSYLGFLGSMLTAVLSGALFYVYAMTRLPEIIMKSV